MLDSSLNAEVSIHEVEDRSIKNSKMKDRKRGVERAEHNSHLEYSQEIHYMCNCSYRIRGENGLEAILEEIKTKNFLKLMKDIDFSGSRSLANPK